MEGRGGHRSSRLRARARKVSVEHMVRACSTNQPILRLSIGSLALITATHWAPGCPSKLLRQRGWGLEERHSKTKNKKEEEGKQQKKKKHHFVASFNEMRVGVFQEDVHDVRSHSLCMGGGGFGSLLAQ